jgi:hypothetical protein
MPYPLSVVNFMLEQQDRDLTTRVKEHQKSVTRDNPDLSKLTEHAHTNHRFIWSETRVIAREEKWRERKVQEAVEILNGGNDVISAPSFVLNPIWFSWIKNRKKVLDKKSQVRRSLRLKKIAMTSRQVGASLRAGQHVRR